MNKLIQHITLKELKKRRQELLEEAGKYFVSKMDSTITRLSEDNNAVDQITPILENKLKDYGKVLFLLTECIRLIEIDRASYNNSLNSFEPYIHKLQLRWSHGVDVNSNEEIKIHLFDLDESLTEYKEYFDKLFPLTLTD